MNFHVVTLFPDVVDAAVRGFGIVGQAINKGTIGLACVTPRTFTANVHHTIDDRPFGGGDGMIMMAEPLSQSVAQIRKAISERASSGAANSCRVIHVSPRGTPLTDAKARELSKFSDLILISSRYGGADQRFLNSDVDEEISIGDYILTGGELAVLVLIDAVARLKPGVLGNESSSKNESFSGTNGLLEHPQFTRPREWNGQLTPEIYMSGDHAKISAYQEALSVGLTALRRPDLLPRAKLTKKRLASIQKLFVEMPDAQLEMCGLAKVGEAVAIRQILQNALERIQPIST
jgi:tRNA (guanine37-N1)-methyltransferase